MVLHDVNVLIDAHRPESRHHEAARDLLEATVNGLEPFALSELVLSGFVRIVTNRRIFKAPTSPDDAVDFTAGLLEQPTARVIRPGPRHWGIFESFCRHLQLRGNLVPDAYHAALAIEHGCEWISFDRDFAKFPGLRWRHPLD